MAPNNLNDLTISQDARILRLRALFQDLAAHTADPDTTALGETWEITKDEMSRLEAKKAYICLFTCAVTRAVHLELVKDMTAETFKEIFNRAIQCLYPLELQRDQSEQPAHFPGTRWKGGPFESTTDESAAGPPARYAVGATADRPASTAARSRSNSGTATTAAAKT
jgi:hypothetical protein